MRITFRGYAVIAFIGFAIGYLIPITYWIGG